MVNFSFRPLTADTWPDLENLFGAKGACGGCWCMTWRQSSKEYERNKGEQNRLLFKGMAERGQPLGIIAYDGPQAVGWCSVSPRKSLVRLENSRLLKSPDDLPVWSITCFFIRKEFRRKGLTTKLIQAATDYAFKNGAPAVDAYPMIPRKENVPEVFAFIGFAKMFEKAGFEVVGKPSESRLIMRLKNVNLSI